jgi:hypothetical protein
MFDRERFVCLLVLLINFLEPKLRMVQVVSINTRILSHEPIEFCKRFVVIKLETDPIENHD